MRVAHRDAHRVAHRDRLRRKPTVELDEVSTGRASPFRARASVAHAAKFFLVEAN